MRNLKYTNSFLLVSLMILSSFLVISVDFHGVRQKYSSKNFRSDDYNSFSLKSSLEIDGNSFVEDGINQNVELFHSKNITFINKNTDLQNLIVQNSISGWNMTQFELNFTNLYAPETWVHFETKNDGSEEFKGNNQFFALSFEVPNTCYLKNMSIFLQYWGSGSGIDESIFSIRIYNATLTSNETQPDEPIDLISDETEFDLTDKPLNQPAMWYQSNFTNRILNISKTYNKTFFAVFQTLDFPNLAGYNDEAYIAYANEELNEDYDLKFYKKDGILGDWNLIDGRNGLLKVFFAPISNFPSSNQINLTVFNTPLDSSGLYSNSSFYPHDKDEFHIPITSSWFGDIHYNATFIGMFNFNKQSSSNFKAEVDKNVLWNITCNLIEFPSDSYNNSANFYYTKDWMYNSLYNDTSLYSNYFIHQDYMQILNISNNLWSITFNQTNNVITTNFQCSSDNKAWNEIQDCILSTDYINITSTFKNSNGKTQMLVTGTN